MSFVPLARESAKFFCLALAFAGSVAWGQQVTIQSISQGPDVAKPTFIFLKVNSPSPVCPETNTGRLRWNGDVYLALQKSMDEGRPVLLIKH